MAETKIDPIALGDILADLYAVRDRRGDYLGRLEAAISELEGMVGDDVPGE